jgi:hypothetical protein
MNRMKQKNVGYKTVVVVNGPSKPNPNCIAPVQYDSVVNGPSKPNPNCIAPGQYYSHSEFNQNSVTNLGSKRQVRRTGTTFPEDTTVSIRRRNAWQGSPWV